jgi:hypothetical protein
MLKGVHCLVLHGPIFHLTLALEGAVQRPLRLPSLGILLVYCTMNWPVIDVGCTSQRKK